MNTVYTVMVGLLLAFLCGCPSSDSGTGDEKTGAENAGAGSTTAESPGAEKAEAKPVPAPHSIAGDLTALADGGLKGFRDLFPEVEFNHTSGELMQDASGTPPAAYERYSNSIPNGGGSVSLTLLPDDGSFTVVIETKWYGEMAGSNQQDMLAALDAMFKEQGGSTKDLGADDSGRQVTVNSFSLKGLYIKYKTTGPAPGEEPGPGGGLSLDYVIATGKEPVAPGQS